MRKTILLSLAIMIAAAVSVVGMSAFEAHVINVTAKIENSLSILTDNIKFGTVFPEEVLDEQINISMSESFLAEDRVDNINYIIKQKPKPREEITTPFPGGVPGHEYCLENSPDDSGNPEDPYYNWCYPSLCEYLSKFDADPDDQNDDPGVEAQHDPGITILEALISKNDNDISDIWDIGLLVPCFAGNCAQDGVILDEYQLDPRLESEVFGCDLWIEVTGFGDEIIECNDTDGDGYCTTICSTCPYEGIDCDDTIFPINPGAQEDCTDDLDNDCDELTDCDDPDCSGSQSCTAEGDIVINEIAWMGTATSTSDEWMELRNMTGNTINLTGWTLNASDGTPSIVLSGSIGPNSYFLLEKTDDTSVPDVAADQIYSGALGNSGELLVLKSGIIIDQVDASAGWPAGDNTTKKTMERCNDGSWHDSLAVHGSPREQNSGCN